MCGIVGFTGKQNAPLTASTQWLERTMDAPDFHARGIPMR